MKKITISALFILITSLVMPFTPVYASCIANPDYDLILTESDIAYQGTVLEIRTEQIGPREIDFVIHNIQKGNLTMSQSYTQLDYDVMHYENDNWSSSSNSVIFKIDSTYQVYVFHPTSPDMPKLNMCSTHEIQQNSIENIGKPYVTQHDYSGTPHHQLEHGIDSKEIKCNEERELFFKASDNQPVCLFQDSISKLLERGYILH